MEDEEYPIAQYQMPDDEFYFTNLRVEDWEVPWAELQEWNLEDVMGDGFSASEDWMLKIGLGSVLGS